MAEIIKNVKYLDINGVSYDIGYFSEEERAKLAGMVSPIEGITINGESVTVDKNKIANLTDIQKKLIAGTGVAIDGNTISVTLDTSLWVLLEDHLPTEPEEGNENKIHLLRVEPVQAGDGLGDWFEEYAWIEDVQYGGYRWELLGRAQLDVDLSNYYTKSEVDSKIADASISLAESTEDNKNFLITETNIEGNTEYAVRTMDTDVTVTTEEITVAGGPLSSLYTDAGLGSTIAAGTDLQSLLLKLFCKEIFPTIKVTDATLVSTIANPVITINTTTVEVGTNVEYTVTSGATNFTATPASVSGMTYGYYDGELETYSKDKLISATSITAQSFSNSVSAVASTIPTLSLSGDISSYNIKFKDENGNDSPEGSATYSGVLGVNEGSNVVKAKNTSAVYTGDSSSLRSVYYASNLKTITSTNYTPNKVSETLTSTQKTSTEVIKTVNGRYKYYVGYVDSVPTDKAGIVALNTFTGWITPSTGITITTGGTLPANKTIAIAVPTTGSSSNSLYKLSSILNGMNLESISSFSESTVEYVLADGKSITYTVYSMGTLADWVYGNITITKA